MVQMVCKIEFKFSMTHTYTSCNTEPLDRTEEKKLEFVSLWSTTL